MLPVDSPTTRVVLIALVVGLVALLAWNAVRSDRVRYRRFQRLRSTKSRQKVFRRWLLQSLLLFGGASVVLLLAAGAFVDPFVEAARDSWPLALFTGLPDLVRTSVGIGLLLVFLALIAVPVLLAGRDEEVTAVGDVQALLPRNRAELRWGAALSLNAGLVEELLFRLALPAVLFGITGSAAIAAVSSVLLFGALHLYQGLPGIVASAVLGTVFLLVFLASGSILWAMLVHALVDLRSLVLIPVVVGRVHEKT